MNDFFQKTHNLVVRLWISIKHERTISNAKFFEGMQKTIQFLICKKSIEIKHREFELLIFSHVDFYEKFEKSRKTEKFVFRNWSTVGQLNVPVQNK